MTPAAIREAVTEAQEFVRRAKVALAEHPDGWIVGTAASGALRRQSLELTRALAAMRKP